MNILLLTTQEIGSLIPLQDSRCIHIIKILKKKEGDEIYAGIINDTLGMAKIISISNDGIIFSFTAMGSSIPLEKITLILGLPRPIQAGRLFKDLASLGVSKIILAKTDLSEKSYAESDFFKNEEWSYYLKEGLIQSGTTILPKVEKYWSLDTALDHIQNDTLYTRIALDNVKTGKPMSLIEGMNNGSILAIGSERGFTSRERDVLEKNNFAFARLGSRILKTETAALAAVSIALSKMQIM